MLFWKLAGRYIPTVYVHQFVRAARLGKLAFVSVYV